MNIRKSTVSDFNDILRIYAHAREQMKRNGNPNQWGDNRPAPETVARDIENENSYVIEASGKVCGVFALIPGDEPAYQIIEGEWLNDKPYGTVHRIASSNSVKGILEYSLTYCERKLGNIRIDTHADNKIMQHLLSKYGYRKCGIIYVEDGTPRIAYQKSLL